MNIAVISGSRADYNMLQNVSGELTKRFNIFPLNININNNNNQDSRMSIVMPVINPVHMMEKSAEITKRLMVFFREHNINYMLVLGDRWEIIGAVQAAIFTNVKIIHLGGGETSEGSYDNIFRDWISRASQIHFVISEKSKKRLEEIGIKDNVYITGSPRMDHHSVFKSKKMLFDLYGLDTSKKTALVVFHPETLKQDVLEGINELTSALIQSCLQLFIICPNVDKGSQELKREFENYFKVYESISFEDWVSFLWAVDVFIGNSSAGITECPSYGLPFVNIGSRQDGREKLSNVFDCELDKQDILNTIELAMNTKIDCQNLYSDGKASQRISDILAGLWLK